MSGTTWRGTSPTPFWLDRADRPEPREVFHGHRDADLIVVGGGFTGLWTALQAKQDDPDRDVVLIEGIRIGHGATGRNGGFACASLTHGFGNGLDRFPAELTELDRLGQENLAGMEQTIGQFGIDCDWQRSGDLSVAVEPWQVEDLRDTARVMQEHGHDVQFLDAEHTRARVNSPTYLAGLFDPNETAIVDPARLAWGLAAACESLGVQIYEGSPITGIDRVADTVTLTTANGGLKARSVALGTNAFPPLLRRMHAYIVPVYDYALMTEPLTAAQRAELAWSGREGVGDSGNQFHYYRLTEDHRILWGGYDAIYHYGSRMNAAHEYRDATFDTLAAHFAETFPFLSDVEFSHAWGGAIDTCTRFSPFWGTAHDGRVGYVAGYTGLGVGASRFGARVLLDLLDGQDTERTRLEMVRSKPLPFPPEPFRYLGIEATRRSLARADQRGGKRNLWLRTLDRVGLGFDS